PRGGAVVDAAHGGRVYGAAVVDRQILRAPVDLPRSGEDDAHLGVVVPACLEQRELALAVDLEIGEWIVHGVEMTRLAGQVEDDVRSTDQAREGVVVANVADVDRHAILDARDVEPV